MTYCDPSVLAPYCTATYCEKCSAAKYANERKNPTKELIKARARIAVARKKLDETGVWQFDKDTQKRIKNGEVVTIWKAK